LIDRFEKEFIGILLVPLKGTLCAVDTNVEIVFVPVGNLGGIQDALGPVLETEKAIPVIIEFASGNKRTQVRTQ
jgi:hypothetical protein